MLSKIIAIIPARGGSKGIPRKNVRLLAGKPLVVHTIEHALASQRVTRVVVSTDDDAIGAVSRAAGAEIVQRPSEISGDTAGSESALIHALDSLRESEGYEPDLVVFLQATSPLRRADDIDNAIEQLLVEEADSLLSANRIEGFVWRVDAGILQSFSYDYRHRQRRQDAPVDYIENGSIYVFKPWVLAELGNRLGGKVSLYEMDPLDSFQIDEPADLARMEQLAPLRNTPTQPDLSQVDLLVLDFDGVLTDNRVLVQQDGTESVFCHRGDGWGIARLKEIGVPVVVLSTERNPVVQARCNKLGIDCVQGCDDKLSGIEALATKYNVPLERIAFVGNDLNDMPALNHVGYPLTVADAHPHVLAIAIWATQQNGGFGAVRELCDLLIAQRPQTSK